MGIDYSSVAGIGVIITGYEGEEDDSCYGDLTYEFADKYGFEEDTIGNAMSGDIDHVVLLKEFKIFDGEWNKQEVERLTKALDEFGFTYSEPKFINSVYCF